MKTILITGANGNLGSAVTNTFLKKGYQVIATVMKESMIADFEANEHLDVKVVDLANEEATLVFVKTCIESYTKIDAALLLAGGFAAGNIYETKPADIDAQINLNFKTALHVVQPMFQHMMDQEQGRIVFIGARPALVPSQAKGMLAYALSKSLLFRLAEVLNETAKGKNVTATVVAPSTLDTPINRKSMPNADPSDWVKPEALAELLEFAVSDTSSIVREGVIKAYNNA
jgi:NAD(P)-dependent dehydrogenase (short-subunit alcohol dehydrogenase family)